MRNDKSFFEKYYLLLIYFLFLMADCCLLYVGNYATRFYVKPLLVPILVLWFMSNTAFNIRSSPQTLAVRLLLYFLLLCTLVSDVCGLFADKFIWTACLFLYSFTYLLYLFIFISIQKNISDKKLYFVYVRSSLPVFFIVMAAAFVFILKVLNLPLEINNIWFYLHAGLIALLCAIIGNMWGVPQMKTIRVLFAIGVFFLIITNIVYSLDEIIFHRRHRILDVLVACSNGLTQIFMILGVIKFIRSKRR